MRLPHGYTNDSFHDDGIVTKHYRGVDAGERLIREAHALRVLTGRLPLPEVSSVDFAPQTLQTLYVSAHHGQELIDAGEAERVLFLCGKILHHLQNMPPQLLQDNPAAGTVIVHGDFGPQNILIEPAEWKAAALIDWEWVHLGKPVEDLAWAEWIVRMHHPLVIPSLSALFQGYGTTPQWRLRHDAMLERCQRLIKFAHHCHDSANVALWERRLDVTKHFTDV